MSEFSFRFLIAENSHNGTSTYYQYVPREPSPEGGFLIWDRYTRVITPMTVDSLLDQMIDMVGGYLLVVSHGSPRHVSIKLVKDVQNTLDEKMIDKLELLLLIDTKIPAILAMPEGTGAERIAKIEKTNGVLSAVGVRERFSDIQSASAALDDFIKQAALDLFAKKDPESIRTMWSITDKVRKVKALPFKRIEFRACRVGSNMSLMKKLRQFFDCDVLVAPKYRVMRAVQRNAIHLLGRDATVRREYANQFPSKNPNFRFCGPCGISQRPLLPATRLTSRVTVSNGHDGLADHVVKDTATRRFETSFGYSVDITVTITNENPSEFDFTIPRFDARSRSRPNFTIFDFLEILQRQFVYEDCVIEPGTVVLGGMWLGGTEGFVLANEPGYLQNLVVVKR